MQTATKAIWIASVAVAVMALLWFLFLLKFTNRAIGPAGPFILYFIWVTTFIFTIVSIVLLVKGVVPNNKIAQIISILFLIIFSLTFSRTLLRQPIYERQLRETEESNRRYREENSRITVDGKYQYMLSLSGTLTDNPWAYISIRDMANNKSIGSIIIDLRMKEIRPVDELPSRALLIELSPTDVEHIYILTTTPHLKEEIEVFEINMETITSRRIE